MSEEKIGSIIRDFVEALMKRDVEKTLSFLTEDVVWVQPEGTFKGKGEVKRLLTWLPKSFWYSQVKIRDAGIGILVKGNKAVYEQIIEGVSAHKRTFEAPAISIFEFSGSIDRSSVRALYDWRKDLRFVLNDAYQSIRQLIAVTRRGELCH